ncbi:hypothetical protein GGX14DRAFT_677369 [Mycena pura]|uniref:Uncharacterized protein n=1 Tax=Mycena pura TaxID=153505 RepID=A0AAD6UYB1_9AGAR|nr:hypothetical protein GGX14DRAFT_677369 [Mycena pura]
MFAAHQCTSHTRTRTLPAARKRALPRKCHTSRAALYPAVRTMRPRRRTHSPPLAIRISLRHSPKFGLRCAHTQRGRPILLRCPPPLASRIHSQMPDAQCRDPLAVCARSPPHASGHIAHGPQLTARAPVPAARHSLPVRSLSVGSRPAFAAHTARDTYSTPVSTSRRAQQRAPCSLCLPSTANCRPPSSRRPPPALRNMRSSRPPTTHTLPAAAPLPAAALCPPPAARHLLLTPRNTRFPIPPARHPLPLATPVSRARAPPHPLASSNTRVIRRVARSPPLHLSSAADALVPGFCTGPARAARCPMLVTRR